MKNTEWKNDATLFITDAETVSNSALVNGNAGKAYLDLADKPENKPKEKELIIKALKKHKGKRKDASADLGISERTLYRKLKEYDIDDL